MISVVGSAGGSLTSPFSRAIECLTAATGMDADGAEGRAPALAGGRVGIGPDKSGRAGSGAGGAGAAAGAAAAAGAG